MTEQTNTDKSQDNDIDQMQLQQERSKHFFDGLSEVCDGAEVKLAYAVVIDEKSPHPLIFIKGSTYPVTKLMIDITRMMKEKLNDELSV